MKRLSLDNQLIIETPPLYMLTNFIRKRKIENIYKRYQTIPFSFRLTYS